MSFDCDSRSGQNQTLELNGGHQYVYSVECGVDTVGSGDTGIDLFAATTYTFEDCLRVCSTFNYNSGTETCKGVSFNTGESLHPTTCFWCRRQERILTCLFDTRTLSRHLPR